MTPTSSPEHEPVTMAVNGPALIYISCTTPHATQQVHRADFDGPSDPRERALLRALLLHALAVLDASEHARARAITAERR